jgi:hypothetical protein
MWTEVETVIGKLVRGKELGVDRVSEVLGVEFSPTLESPLAQYYRATLPAGPLREVELRFIPKSGVSFLVLRSDPDRPVVVRPGDLRSYGAPKWRSIEPKAGPEGQVAECFELPGMELRVGYRTKSRQLEAVSLGTGGAR